jgi:hypothetical protein
MPSLTHHKKTKKNLGLCLGALITIFAAPGFAAEEVAVNNPDAPLGRWRGNSPTAQGLANATLVIARNEKGELVGQWFGQYASAPLRLVTYNKGWLSFLLTIPMPGNTSREVDFAGEFIDGTLQGAFFIQNNSFGFTARRIQPGDTTPPTPPTPPTPATTEDKRPATPPHLIGTWQGHLEAQPEPRPLRLVIEKHQNGLLVTDDKSLPITSFVPSGERLLVAVRTQTPQKTRTINIEFILEGDKLTGQAFFADNPDRTLGEVKLVKKNKK